MGKSLPSRDGARAGHPPGRCRGERDAATTAVTGRGGLMRSLGPRPGRCLGEPNCDRRGVAIAVSVCEPKSHR